MTIISHVSYAQSDTLPLALLHFLGVARRASPFPFLYFQNPSLSSGSFGAFSQSLSYHFAPVKEEKVPS